MINLVINIFSPKFIEMSRYKGRCLRFVDSKNWTYLVFNHYDSYSTTKQITDEIANYFDLSYSFPEANGSLSATFKNGNVLKELADKYKPSELSKLFPSSQEPRISPELLRSVIFSNIEPREAQDDGWKGGGRYYISNLNWNLAETEFNHADSWDKRGTEYLVLGGGGGYEGRLDISERAPASAPLERDLMPKSYYYVYSHYENWSKDQFNKPEQRVHKILKSYMLNPPIDPIKPESILETATQTEVDALKSKDSAIDANIKSVEESIENNRKFIDELKSKDKTLQLNIDTLDKKRINVVNNVDVLQKENLETKKEVLDVHKIIKQVVETQKHNYNFEWSAWEAPIRLKENENGSVQMAKNRENSKKRVSKVENDVAELKMRLSTLADINGELVRVIKACFEKIEKLEIAVKLNESLSKLK